MSTIKHHPHVDEVGSLFVKAGAISEPQLERARRIVAKLKEQKTVGELTLCIQAANLIASRVAQSADAQPERDLMAFAPVVALDLTEVELATLIVDLEDDIAILTSQFGSYRP